MSHRIYMYWCIMYPALSENTEVFYNLVFGGEGGGNNDLVKQNHQTESSKIDLIKESLIARKRLEIGYSESTTCIWKKRKYVKSNDRFVAHENPN